jgi:hypothetical protein
MSRIGDCLRRKLLLRIILKKFGWLSYKFVKNYVGEVLKGSIGL